MSFFQFQLSEEQRLHVEAGDHFGFTWLHYGVIVYSKITDKNYCEAMINPQVGNDYTFENRVGDREYSIKLKVICSKWELLQC